MGTNTNGRPHSGSAQSPRPARPHRRNDAPSQYRECPPDRPQCHRRGRHNPLRSLQYRSGTAPANPPPSRARSDATPRYSPRSSVSCSTPRTRCLISSQPVTTPRSTAGARDIGNRRGVHTAVSDSAVETVTPRALARRSTISRTSSSLCAEICSKSPSYPLGPRPKRRSCGSSRSTGRRDRRSWSTTAAAYGSATPSRCRASAPPGQGASRPAAKTHR